VSESQAHSGFGALVARLPPVLGPVAIDLLWRQADVAMRPIIFASATFWYVFAALQCPADPGLCAAGWGYLAVTCGRVAFWTIALYLLMTWIGPKLRDSGLCRRIPEGEEAFCTVTPREVLCMLPRKQVNRPT